MTRFGIAIACCLAGFGLGWVVSSHDPNQAQREVTVGWIEVSRFLDSEFDEREADIRLVGRLETADNSFRLVDPHDEQTSIGMSRIEPECLERHVGTIVEVQFIPRDSFERELLWIKSFIEVEWFGTFEERRDPNSRKDTPDCSGYPYVFR